jgi:hypothetical protein
MGFKEKMMSGMMDKMSSGEKKEMMDAMMESFIGKMSNTEKQDMMDTMMNKFFSTMSPEDKQNMMSSMMPKMMGNMMGGKDMGMMGMMMGGMTPGKNAGGEKQEMPWDMCKKMMSNIEKSNDIALSATPEIQQLFDDWARQIEDEICEFIKNTDKIIVDEIQKKFKITKDSVIFFLNRLAKKEKIKFDK